MTIWRTASIGRALWYGSLTVGAILGGFTGAILAIHYTKET